MQKYMIERPLPGAGNLSAEELQQISAKSNSVLHELGPDIVWAHSYVSDDAITCVYHTNDVALIEEHAKRGGFPCENVRAVGTVIDPATGNGA